MDVETASDTGRRRGAGGHPIRAERAGRGARHRAGGLLAPVRRAEGAHRGLPAARRGARVGARRRRVSAPGSSTRRRRRARRATASPPRRSTSCSATRSPTRRRARCCRPSRRPACRSCCSACSRRATLDYEHTDTGEWLANCAACCVPEIAGACTRAGIPYDTVAGTIEGDERAWGEDRRLGARRRGRPRAAAVADRVPRAHLSGDARPLHRLHRRARPGRRARRGAGDRRPRDAHGRGHERGDRRQAGRDPGHVHVRRPVRGPDRGADLRRAARLVGARGGRPGPAGGRLRAGRADLLLPRAGGQRGRAPRRGRDRRQLAADRARRADGGGGRPQDQPRPADPRPPRRRRLLHRVLRARLRRTTSSSWATTGPATSRSPRSARCCARSSSTTASAARG